MSSFNFEPRDPYFNPSHAGCDAEIRSQLIWADYGTRIDTTRYDLNGDGVFRVKTRGRNAEIITERTRICSVPVWVSSLNYDPETDESWVELTWCTGENHAHSRWVPRFWIFRGSLKTWANFGGAELRPAQLRNYLKHAIALVRHQEHRPVIREIGWRMSGEKPRLALYADPKDTSAFYLHQRCLRSEGSLEPWGNLIEWLLRQPFQTVQVIWAMLGLSAAAPLVRHLQTRNPIFVVISPTQEDDKLIASVAQNIWCDWYGSHSPADAGIYSIEEMTLRYADVARTIVDCHSAVRGSNYWDLDGLIRLLANGQRRLKIDNRTKEPTIGSFYGSFLMTSKRDFFSDLPGGARLRCIVLRDPALYARETNARLKSVLPHYGAVGKRLEALYSRNLGRYLSEAQWRITEVMSKFTAANSAMIGDDRKAVALAGQGLAILSEIFDTPLPVESTLDYLVAAVRSQREAPYIQ